MSATFMTIGETLKRHFLGLLLAGGALGVAAACSSTSNTTVTPTATATPTVAATATATSAATSTASPAIVHGSASCAAGAQPASATVTLQNGTVTTPTTGGCSLAITFANVTQSTTATVTVQTSPPPNYPTPSPSSVPNGFSGSGTAVFYVVIKPNGNYAATTSPSFVFTANSVTPGNTFYSGFADTGPSSVAFQGYNGGVAGTVSGNTISFPSSGGGGGGGLTAGDTYALSLVYF